MRSIIIYISILFLFIRIESKPTFQRIDIYPIITEVQVIDSLNWYIEIDISRLLNSCLNDVSVPCSTSIFCLTKGIMSTEYKTKIYINENGFGVIAPKNIIGDSKFKIYNRNNEFQLQMHKDSLNGIWEMCIDTLPPNQSLCIYDYYNLHYSNQYLSYARCLKPSIGSPNIPTDYLCKITGKIKDIHGTPVPKINVYSMSEGPTNNSAKYSFACSEFSASSMSDSTGRFALKNLIADYYIVGAYIRMSNMGYNEDNLALINLEPADSIDTEITLRYYQHLVSNKYLFRYAYPKSKPKLAVIEIPSKKVLRISFTHAFDVPVSYFICVYDIRSRSIAEFTQQVMHAGAYSIDWDEKNEKGNRAPAGRYICRITDGISTSTINFVIIK